MDDERIVTESFERFVVMSIHVSDEKIKNSHIH